MEELKLIYDLPFYMPVGTEINGCTESPTGLYPYESPPQTKRVATVVENAGNSIQGLKPISTTDQSASRDEEIDVLRGCMLRMAKQLSREPATTSPMKRITKLGPDDDVKVYLEIFERTADRERWSADQWGHILEPFLTWEAQRAYRDLTPHQAGHYPTLKRAILTHYEHSGLPAQAQRYHDWAYDPFGSVWSQITQLVWLAERWLVEGEGPPLLDRLVIDHCIRALPPGAKRWASGNQPRMVNDLIELLENHQVTQRLCVGE